MGDARITCGAKQAQSAALAFTLAVTAVAPASVMIGEWVEDGRISLYAETMPPYEEPAEPGHAPGSIVLQSAATSGAFISLSAHPLADMLVVFQGVRTMDYNHRNKLIPVQMPAPQLLQPSKST